MFNILGKWVKSEVTTPTMSFREVKLREQLQKHFKI